VLAAILKKSKMIKIKIRKRIILGILLTGLISLGIIDYEFLSPRRVLNENWEPKGGRDYSKTHLDVFSTVNAKLKSDTLILENGKKYLLKYCNFGSLWLTDLNRTYTARYVHVWGSKNW
jgi:hypothetical protein